MSTRCARCGGPIIEIDLSSDGTDLTMRSCSTCDTREWANDGEPVALDEALGELSATSAERRHRRSR
ncbi:MAG: hypothetical protein U5K29_09065 [Acidimicrobiales bacterium]|nr:hypothetical protein [Acidimicrobiales bacterium]